MQYKVNDVLPFEIQEGTVLDYINNEFTAVFCDSIWSKEEIEGLKRKKLEIGLVVRGNLILFLVTIDDCIDTSDFPFIYDVSEHKIDLNHVYVKDEGIPFTIYLIDTNHTVIAAKEVKLNATMSNEIIKIIKLQKDADYETMMLGLEKFQLKYEPYEMEEFVVVKTQY